MITQMSATSDSSTSWQRNLRAIWFAELVAIVGFAVAIPILPLYVKELGVEGERQVRLWSGVIFSAQAVTMAIFGPIWGALSDRFGRKLMVERAMFAGSVIMTLMGFAQTPQQLALLRTLQGCLTGTVTAATALVATSVPSERAGYALGTLQMAIYVGASAGPLLGGLVADTLGYRAAFLVTGFLLLTAALGVLVFVKEPSRSEPDPSDSVSDDGEAMSLQRRVLRHLAPVLGSAPLLSVLGVHLLMRLASRLLSAILPLFVEAVAPPAARVATLTGVITGANALGGAIGGRQFGELGDRVGYRSILAACALLSTLFYIPQSMVGRSIWLIPLQAGAGLAMGGILASISASLAALAPRGREGIVYGVDATVVSVANAIGPMTGSSMAAWLGLRAPFLAAAVVFVLGGIAALQLLPKPATTTS
jgi:DHA1 family multidrug resistance protein-like MFS transporter